MAVRLTLKPCSYRALSTHSSQRGFFSQMKTGRAQVKFIVALL